MSTKTNFISALIIAGLTSGAVALAQDTGAHDATAKTAEAGKEKDSCKGHKDSCKGKSKKVKKAHGDKDSCKGKEGCGEKKASEHKDEAKKE